MSSLVETASLIGASRRFLSGDESAGESLWDLSVDEATAGVLLGECRIVEVVESVVFSSSASAKQRLQEIGVGILANLRAQKGGLWESRVPEVLFLSSFDPGTLGECLRYFAARYEACSKDTAEKILLIAENSLDTQLVAKTFAFVVGLYPSDPELLDLGAGLFTATVDILEDPSRRADLSTIDLHTFTNLPASGLDALLLFLLAYLQHDTRRPHNTNHNEHSSSSTERETIKIRTICEHIHTGDDYNGAEQHTAKTILEELLSSSSLPPRRPP